METKLGRLAARWRGADDPQQSESLVKAYHALSLCMITLGFHASLDVDAELPDALMPQEYFNLFK